MFRNFLLMLMLAVLVTPAGLLFAQMDDPPPPPPDGPRFGPGRPPGHPPGPPPPIGPKLLLEAFDRVTRPLDRILEMTPEQKEKYNDLVKRNRAELEEIVKKLDQQRGRFDADLNALLTPDQQAKLKQLKQTRERALKRWRDDRPGGEPGMGMGPAGPGGKGQRIQRAIEEMDLPPEKRERVQKILADTREKFQDCPPGDREAHQQIMRGMMEQLREILSPQEMQELRSKMRPEGGPQFDRPGKGRPGGPDRPRRGGARPGGRAWGGPDDRPEDTPPPPPENDSLW